MTSNATHVSHSASPSCHSALFTYNTHTYRHNHRCEDLAGNHTCEDLHTQTHVRSLDWLFTEGSCVCDVCITSCEVDKTTSWLTQRIAAVTPSLQTDIATKSATSSCMSSFPHIYRLITDSVVSQAILYLSVCLWGSLSHS